MRSFSFSSEVNSFFFKNNLRRELGGTETEEASNVMGHLFGEVFNGGVKEWLSDFKIAHGGKT